jgi:CubicO group peptidase (beta-lactamase class C family)
MATYTNSTLSGRVQDAIDRDLDEQRIVGAVVLIARDGNIVHQSANGFADRENGRPMREDTIFRYSSVTKPIVTTAAMALIERGKLNLDDPATKWLPEFRPRMPDGREPVITMQHLLTHTAGLNYTMIEPVDGPYHRAGVSDGLDNSGLSIDEELRRIASVPLLYEPGTSWEYSVALDVLGAVMARVTKSPLADVVAEFVTTPLLMRDTRFTVREIDRARLAVPYADDPPRPPRLMNDPDHVPQQFGSPIAYSPSRIFDANAFQSGGAGMAGTAGDVLTLLETIRTGGGRILKPETTRAMMSNQIGNLRVTAEPTPSWGFGFGGSVLVDPALAKVPQAAGTWKWGGVYGHSWFVDPVNRLTVVALTNTALEGLFGRFPIDLMQAVYGQD